MRHAAVVLLLVLCAAAPLVAHALGSRCWIYLPAHVPVLLIGLAFGLRAGIAGGALVAIVEFGWGMMGFVATLPIACELAAYGAAAGAAGARARTWSGLLGSLVFAMLVGRVMHLVLAVIARGASVSHEMHGLFFEPWPGIVLQLVALPLAALACRRLPR